MPSRFDPGAFGDSYWDRLNQSRDTSLRKAQLLLEKKKFESGLPKLAEETKGLKLENEREELIDAHFKAKASAVGLPSESQETILDMRRFGNDAQRKKANEVIQSVIKIHVPAQLATMDQADKIAPSEPFGRSRRDPEKGAGNPFVAEAPPAPHGEQQPGITRRALGSVDRQHGLQDALNNIGLGHIPGLAETVGRVGLRGAARAGTLPQQIKGFSEAAMAPYESLAGIRHLDTASSQAIGKTETEDVLREPSRSKLIAETELDRAKAKAEAEGSGGGTRKRSALLKHYESQARMLSSQLTGLEKTVNQNSRLFKIASFAKMSQEEFELLPLEKKAQLLADGTNSSQMTNLRSRALRLSRELDKVYSIVERFREQEGLAAPEPMLPGSVENKPASSLLQEMEAGDASVGGSIGGSVGARFRARMRAR